MNVKTNNEKLAERKDHFAIRKLTVGAASVLIGTSLWLGSTNAVAKADTQENNDQNSDADVVSESNKAVNTQKVDKVVVETQQSTTNNVPSNNDAPTADTNADNQAQTQKAAEKPAETQKTESSETKSPVVNSNETTLSEKQDQDKVESSQVTSGELNTKQEEKPNNTSVVENNKVETASPTTEQNNKQLEDQNKTVTNQKQAQTPQVSDKNEEYSVNITNVDDSTGQTLYGTDSFKAKAGDKSHRIYTGYVGYKLMNPEALEGYEVQYPAFGHANLVVPDHDVNLTLHFAPLAPTTVEYVDTDGNLLTKFSDSSKASTSKSPYSDQDGIEDSKFMARAIDIPGYELVSDPVVEKPITQVSTKDDLNPMIIKFVYKKVAKNAEQGLPDGGGAGITGVGEDYGINWSKLPGGVSIDLVNKTYGDNSFEKTINNMDERYTKQGFSYIGVLNDHKDSDLTNRLESYVAVHFLPHKSVTVNYVDQDGKKLADSVKLSFNKENPDQTNNGVNPKANWYPNGEWKSEQKSFDGYNLKTVRGATEGKFTTFNYTVTYVYTNQTSGNVVYIDDTDQKDLKDVALNGKIGSNIDYSTTDEIANYEKQGYELVSDNFSNGAKIFNADENKNKFTVHLKHKIETTTVSQDGNQVIHYVYADGSKAANDNEQTTTFVKTTKTDAVNGKVIESSWAPENYTFKNVASPLIENYHPDKENVKGSTVTPDNSKVEVTVTYIENGTALRGQDTKPSTQTVKFVDEEGHELKQAVVSPTFNYEYSGDTYDKFTGKQLKEGSWNADSHTFDTVTVPVIDGYVAIDGFSKKNNQVVVGGLTSTRDNLNVVAEVVYKKVGKIIPVDPSGKPIPDVPTPTYSNDPTDPTKVTPDEPVPTIPKMTPQTPTLTPTDPGKDTPVPYNPVVNDKGEVNVFVHDNTTGQNLTDYGYNSGSEDVGTKVSYDKDKVITELTNKGYKVINPDVTIPGEIAKGTTNVTIYVEHDVVPVNPTNPGKPGEPINPNDPDGPKYPNGTDTTDLTRRVTRTINFINDDGTVLRASIDQTIIFTATGELDKVTGKWTKTLTWSPDQQVNGMDVPFIDGYHVVNISKDGDGVKSINSVTLSHTDQDYVVNVVYSKNGQINPVKDQVAIVNYIDSDENNKLIITSGDLTGKAGEKIDYSTADTIQDLENKGYVLVNDGFPANAAYDHDNATTQTYTVILKHGIVPVTPDKPGNPGQPINPNDPNGPKWPQGTDENSVKRTGTQTIHYTGAGENTPKDDVQEFTFTKNMSVDKVTGQIVDDGSWNVSSYTFGKVDTPVVDGYHADQLTAGGTIITPEDLNKTVTVNYVPSDKVTTIEGKQIIHFVDGNNTPLRDPDTQSHTFKITNGKSDTPDYTFNIINVPVINGYVAEVKTAGGKTITPSNPLAEVTVVYHKIGKIVPVDPSGKPISDAPTPSYKNDPTDPTKVTPDEPVPNVPGYRPQNPSPITPENPTQDTNVPYTKDPEAIKANGKVTYIDDTTGDTIRTDSLQGNVGDKITYTTKDAITNFENKGYELVSNNFKDGNETFAKDGNDFEVHFKHQTIPVTPDKPGNPGQPINPNDPNGPKWPEGTDSKSLTKIGTQTVHYQGADGQTPKDNVSTVEFKHEVLVDKVTGKIVKDNGWTLTQTYKAITTPTINGYTPDKNSVGGETVTLDQNGNGDIDKGYTVTYKKNAVPTPETVIGKQTITFVDGDNNTQLRNPEIQTHKFTNGESSYTFGTINVPVIDGYVAEVTIAGGKTVTPANPDASVVVVYHKIGKIIPVDPNHNPIPDVPAPKYQNNPTDPTKVVPKQPTPDIPGYTPAEKTVTPQSPIEDTPVVYEKPKTIETIRPLPQNIPAKAKKSPATHTVTENKAKKDEHIQTVKPHAANVIGRTGIVRTNAPAENTIVSNKQTVQSTVSAKQALPQTGQANDSAAIVAGSLAAGLGLIGLAGVKKRKIEK